MAGELFELDPMADRRARAERVARLRDRVADGTYRIPATLVAEAMLRQLDRPEHSSWHGPDADARGDGVDGNRRRGTAHR